MRRVAVVLTMLIAVVALAGPFPPPRVALVTDKTKCDWGPVISVDATKGQLVVNTPPGPLLFLVGTEVQVFDKNGTAVGGLARLTPNQKVRVYYVVEDGARAKEIDLE